MTAEKVKRASYTLEYKLETVRLVQGGQSCAAKGQLAGAGAGTKPVSAEQMELTRLRAEQLGDGCAQDGLVQTVTRTRIHFPLGSWQSVLQSRTSEHTG